MKEASRAPITSTMRHSLFCGVFSTGDGVEYTGLLGGLPIGIPGLPVGSSSERNRLCPEDTTVGGAGREGGGGEDDAAVEELLPVEFDICGGCVREGEGISVVGVAMVSLIASRAESSKFKKNLQRTL